MDVFDAVEQLVSSRERVSGKKGEREEKTNYGESEEQSTQFELGGAFADLARGFGFESERTR